MLVEIGSQIKFYAKKIFLLLGRGPGLNYLFLVFAKYWHPYINDGAEHIHKKYKSISDYLNCSYRSFRLSNTGVLFFFCEDFVVSVSLGDGSNEALKRSYQTYQKMRSSELSTLFNYQFQVEAFEGLRLYKMERLFHSDELNMDYLHGVLLRNSRQRFDSDIFEFSGFIYPTLNLRRLKEIVTEDALPTNWGFVHGDLTPHNVLINRFGEHVLIDLDKSESPGPCIYDKIHYKVELTAGQRNFSWVRALGSSQLLNDFTPLVRAYYLLARLYKESIMGARGSNQYYISIDLAANRLLIELVNEVISYDLQNCND